MVLLSVCQQAWSQEQLPADSICIQEGGDVSKFMIGGSVGFSNSPQQMDISPELGYSPFSFWQIGVGATLQYGNNSEGVKNYTYGGRFITRLQLKEKWPFLHAEYNMSYQPDSLAGANAWKNSKNWEGKGLLGVGYPISIGKSKTLHLLVLKDLSQTGGSSKQGWLLRTGIVSPLQIQKGKGAGLKGGFSWTKDSTRFADKPFSERLTFGGDMNFSLPSPEQGNPFNTTAAPGSQTSDTSSLAAPAGAAPTEVSLSLSPTIMYEALRGLYIGTGPSIQYTQRKDAAKAQIDFGLKGFLRYKALPVLPYLQIEYGGMKSKLDSLDESRLESSAESSAESPKVWQTQVMLGGGYTLKLGGMGNIDIALMRQLNWQQATHLQASPWSVRVGVSTQLGGGISGGVPRGVPSIQELPKYLALPVKKALEKLNLEGNMAVSVGKPTKVDLSPTLNLPIDSTFSVGVGISYRFEQDSLDLDNKRNEQYGGRVYLRYQPKERLPYLQVEYEGIRAMPDSIAAIPDNTILKKGIDKYWEHSALLGVGYSLKISKKASFAVTVLRNLTYKGETPVHNSPWTVRAGVSSKLIKTQYQVRSGHKMPPPEAKTNFLIGDIFKVEGTMSVALGTNSVVDMSPQLAYDIKKWWTVGAGPVLRYQKNRDKGGSQTGVSQSIYGGRVATRVVPQEGFPFGQLELESLKGQSQANLPRDWHTAFLVGGGVDFPIGGRSGFKIAVLYDMSWQGNQSLRNDPWVIRFGMGI